MVYLSGVYSSDEFFEFLINGIVVILMYLGDEILSQGQDRTTAELTDFHLFGNLFPYLKVRFYFECLAQWYLCIGILHHTVIYNNTVAPYLYVALIGVDDDIKVLI